MYFICITERESERLSHDASWTQNNVKAHKWIRHEPSQHELFNAPRERVTVFDRKHYGKKHIEGFWWNFQYRSEMIQSGIQRSMVSMSLIQLTKVNLDMEYKLTVHDWHLNRVFKIDNTIKWIRADKGVVNACVIANITGKTYHGILIKFSG